MNSAVIGILAFLALMFLIFNGFPIAIAMFTVSAFGFLILKDWNFAIINAQFGSSLFLNAASYNFAVLPLFMLLGLMASTTGIAEGAFRSIRSWLGRVTGGTLYTVIVANAVYGACSASSSAGAIIFSQLAMPSLNQEGYDENLSLGVTCSSGALASLIPPSNMILTVCLVAPASMYMGQTVSLSLGTGLMCGIGPGILLTIILCLVVRLYGLIKKGTLPPRSTEKVPTKEKLASLRLLIPILVVFFVMIGGASLGWFSTTVAGAIGSFVVTVYAIAKRISMKRLFKCFWDACLMQGGMFLIIVAGNVFSRFIVASGLTTYLANAVQRLNAPPLIMFIIVMIFYLIGGAIMNVVPLIICTSSVVFAVLVEGCGYHPYVLMAALVLMVEVAQLTPPIGVGTYMVANALRIDPMKIFKAVAPFFFVMFLFAILLAVFPQVVLWLPRTLGVLSF